MVDKLQQISASQTPARTPLSSTGSLSSSVAKPVAANSSAPAAKKASVKAKSVKAKPARKAAAPKKAKATKSTSAKAKSSAKSYASSSTATGASTFDSILKSGEAFFNFKPNTQTVEKMMTQSKTQMEKMAQDAASFGRESVEAYVKSSGLWMKGCEDLMRTAMSLAQSSAEKQTKFVKEAMSSKTLNEWAEIQNKIAQTGFDDFMSGATKLSEQCVKVLTECSEPVNAQTSKLVKKATQSMAA